MTPDINQRVVLSKLQQRLLEPLPGKDAHRIMAPRAATSDQYYMPRKDARHAAVMLLLYPEQRSINTLFIRRTKHEQDKHSGQISFPGGKLDQTDNSLLDCALRETHEEVGIDSQQIDVLGSLSPLYVYASNFLVQPFVGFVREAIKLSPNVDEVDQVIKTPVDYLSNPKIIRQTDLTVRDYRLKEVPYYDLNGHVLWGATAMMLTEFLQLWRLDNP